MDKITQLSTPSLLDVNGDIADPYRGFIAKSKYNRWLEDEGRRETWKETVDRYVDWIVGVQEKRGVTVRPEDVEDVRHAITYHHVMPSMRALMTAGPAADRNNISVFNCSFLAVDSVRAFDEALIILMHGTGVGFSVENKYVDKLPEVAESFHNTTTVVKVEDSKEGWAKAFKEWLALLWSGQVPTYDVSQVRPKGARLKVFGGRASGPEPLEGLFKFSRDLLISAAGRKITNLEAHDLMCKVAEIVVVGGVRRAALISLSDLGSRDMSEAKAGAWWTNNSQRALANNSAVYLKKPNMETFFREWKSLYDSKSGERGMFNLGAARKGIDSDRRDASLVSGTNPSLIAGTRVYTTEGVKNIEDLENTEFQIRNLYGNISKATCWKSGVDEEVLKLNIKGGHSHTATPKHKWPVWDGETWVKRRTDQLKPGDKIPNLISYEMFPDGDKGTYDDGFIVGWNLGDGWQTYRPKGLQIGFIVGPEDREQGIDKKLEGILSKLGSSANFQGKDEINVNNSALRKLFATYGVKHKTEGLPTAVWDSTVSDDFRRGVIDGLFSADGSIDIESRRIHFSQSSNKMIRDIASLLGFFGVKTTSRTVSASAGKAFPQKYVGEARNKVFTSTVLRIGEHANVQVFSDNFTLSHHRKQRDLQAILDAPRKHNVRPTNWYLEVVSIEDAGTADVWDISVFDDTHAFQLDHGISGNCGEILLRDKEFCNLSEVVARAEDTPETLLEKIRIATIIGTWQASLTNFKYLRKKWKDNTEEEALLGVSITGIYGNSLLNGSQGKDVLQKFLAEGRRLAEDVNEIEARRIGVNKSAAISCVKPSGSVSQLVGTSSGIHPWYAHKYERRVRANNHDPLCQLMKDQGVPWEPEVNKPEDTTVFSFALEAPEGSIVQSDVNALDHLDLWMTYKKYWADHNPSVTVTVEEDEWLDVGAYVYKNFDDIVGVSFLPSAGNHTYAQAPFEIVEEDRIRYLKEQVSSVDWSGLSIYEISDTTTGSQELACVAGACEVVDLDEEIEKVEVPTINLDEV